MVGMAMTIHGTIPHPPTADARPLAELATELRQLAHRLHQPSGQFNQTATTGSAAAESVRTTTTCTPTAHHYMTHHHM